MLGWLSQSSVPERVTLAISLPNSEAWQSQFLGAILLLTEERNWDKHGALSSEEMADEWRAVFFDFVNGVASMIPAGVIVDYGGASAPDGWLFCDGTTLYRSAYAALFAAIGENYGAGNGTTTFTIPNFPHRVSVGLDSAIAEFDSLGEVGGTISHTLTIGEIPSHTHVQNAHTHSQNAHTHTQDAHTHVQNSHGHEVYTTITGTAGSNRVAPNGVTGATGSVGSGSTVATNQTTVATNQTTTPTNQTTVATNQTAGTGGSHNNMPPYLVVNKIIKY